MKVGFRLKSLSNKNLSFLQQPEDSRWGGKHNHPNTKGKDTFQHF